MVESLPGGLGPLQGTSRHAPGLPQRTSPLAEGMEDIESLLELGQTGVATTRVVEPHPLPQAGAVVAGHGLEGWEPGEFLRPGRAVAGRGHPPGHPAETL